MSVGDGWVLVRLDNKVSCDRCDKDLEKAEMAWTDDVDTVWCEDCMDQQRADSETRMLSAAEETG